MNFETGNQIFLDYPQLVCIHNCSRFSNQSIIEYNTFFFLFSGTVNIDRKDYYGKTPLYWASYKGHKTCVEELLKFGAKVNSRCRHGGTPLHAVVSLYPECALALIKVLLSQT